MRFRTAFLVACLAFAVLVGTASAQTTATFVLKSGERISGTLLDFDLSGWLVSSNGQERRIPRDEMAVVDFTGSGQNLPAPEVARLDAGQHLLVTRDGQVIEGKMNDVNLTGKRVNFLVHGEARDFWSNEVARIYVSSPGSGGVATSGSAGQDATTVHVPADRAWTPTGLTVRQGEVLTFSSSGQIHLSADGSAPSAVVGRPNHHVSARGSMPTTLAGALIGRIGNGRPFAIGDLNSITAPASGPLYLGVNDDQFTDNSGEFVVSVSGGATGGRGIRRR